jgi:hypothetical protein
MSQLIGISGFARSGKDTAFERSKLMLAKEGKEAVRFAFADALKSEVDKLLLEHAGISAFTENKKDKELIRPLLVTYGTEIRRKLDPNCWIKKIQQDVVDQLNLGKYVFVTDVRFQNEAEWIRLNGGFLLNISRSGASPANHEEHRQYHRMKKLISYNIMWDTYGDDNLDQCDEHILPFLSHLIKSKPLPKFEQVM